MLKTGRNVLPGKKEHFVKWREIKLIQLICGFLQILGIRKAKPVGRGSQICNVATRGTWLEEGRVNLKTIACYFPNQTLVYNWNKSSQ